MMIDDDTLKQLLRINDELLQLCKWLNEKRDMETSSRLIPLVDDLTHILIEAGKNKLHKSTAATNHRRLTMARTTHRSKSGKKLYAVRDKQGRFKDIQSYKRAHGQDIKRRSKRRRNKVSAGHNAAIQRILHRGQCDAGSSV